MYGPYENPERIVPTVIRALLKKEIAKCTHGEQIRDFLYVYDVAAAFVALLESDLQGALNIASGQPLSLKEVILKIADKLDGRDLIKLGAVVSSAGQPRQLVADTFRLHNELKWRPKYNIDEGLAATIDWWKKHENNYR